MLYIWDDTHGGRLDSGRLFVPVDGRPLPGTYSKLRFANGRGTKVVSGSEVPLTPIEAALVRVFLADYL